jgi:A/G-specific adenine glycosylase
MDSCVALGQGNVTDYPGKKPKKDKPTKSLQLLMLQNNRGEILLQQRPSSGIWGGLWSFPELPLDSDAEEACQDLFSAPAQQLESWPSYRHTFSHYHLNITPVLLKMNDINFIAEAGWQWVWPASPGNLGLPAPINILLTRLNERQAT